jgi:tripartite ATP-independent transporter DctM subunit
MIVLILVGSFVLLMLLGVPIAFAIGIAAALGALGYAWMGNPFVIDNVTLVQKMLFGINSFPLLAVVFFVFTGAIMAHGGVAKRLVAMAEVLVGRFPGGLAQINVLSSMFFGGVSGSAVADVSSIGRMMITAMVADGYSKSFATAITLTSATMGPIIPPSIAMILFAYLAGNVSVGGLLLGGVVPGILIGLGQLVVAYVHGRLYHPTRTPALPRGEKLRRIGAGLAGMATLLIILGGITFGITTATEAGAIAALYALFLTIVVYRELSVRDLPAILWETCLTTAVVLFLIATTSVFSFILAYEKVPAWVAENFLALADDRWMLLVLLNLLLLVTGMFIDMTPALIMIVPIILPLAQKLGIDLVHLGVLMVVNLAFGLITPPVGTSLFVGCRIAGLPITAVVKPMLPLLAVMIATLFLVTFVPELVLWLPRRFGFVT